MPYTRDQLLAAVRTDHPEFKGVDDEKLFSAISTDHPDMVRDIASPKPLSVPSAMMDTVGQKFGLPAISGALGGARDAVVGGASGLYHAFTDPASENDKVGGFSLPYVPTVAKRLLFDPQVAQYHQAQSMGDTAPWSQGRILKGIHTVASVVPGAGPIIGAVADRAATGDWSGAAGMGATALALPRAIEEGGSLIGGATDAAVRALSNKKLPVSRDSINNLSTIIRGRGAATGAAPQSSAIAIRPIFQQAVHELGFAPDDVALKEKAGQSDVFGDLYRGTTRDTHMRLAQRASSLMNSEGGPVPLPIATADRMVDIADRPIRSTIDRYRSMMAPQVKSAVAASLRTHAGNATLVGDDALARGYTNLADRVTASDGTVGAMDDFKAQANKETNRLFNLSPSREIAAQATPVFAWRTLGDEVRGHLYPFLADQGAPDLSHFGRIESSAIRARDGIFNNWAKSAGANASDSLTSYLDHVLGKSPAQAAISPGSNSAMASRAIGGRPMALADFNTRFKGSIGNMDGYQPPTEIGPGVRHPMAQPAQYATPPTANPLVPPANPLYGSPDTTMAVHPMATQTPQPLMAQQGPHPTLNAPSVPVDQVRASQGHPMQGLPADRGIAPPAIVGQSNHSPVAPSSGTHAMGSLDVAQRHPVLPAENDPIPNSVPHGDAGTQLVPIAKGVVRDTVTGHIYQVGPSGELILVSQK